MGYYAPNSIITRLRFSWPRFGMSRCISKVLWLQLADGCRLQPFLSGMCTVNTVNSKTVGGYVPWGYHGLEPFIERRWNSKFTKFPLIPLGKRTQINSKVTWIWRRLSVIEVKACDFLFVVCLARRLALSSQEFQNSWFQMSRGLLRLHIPLSHSAYSRKRKVPASKMMEIIITVNGSDTKKKYGKQARLTP
jgi:hypothetical protein